MIGVLVSLFIITLVVVVIIFYPPYSSSASYKVPDAITTIKVDCNTANVYFDSTNEENIIINTTVHTFYKMLYDTTSINIQISSDEKVLNISETDTMNVSGQGLMKGLLTNTSIKISLPISSKITPKHPLENEFLISGIRLNVKIITGNMIAKISPNSKYDINSVNINITDKGSVSLKNLYASSMNINVHDGNVSMSDFIIPTIGFALIRTMSGDITIDGIYVAHGSVIDVQANMGNTYFKLAPELSCLTFKLMGNTSRPSIYQYGPRNYILNRTDSNSMTVEGTLISPKCTSTKVTATGNKVVLLLAQQSISSS